MWNQKKNLIYKIAVSDSQTGFILENTEEALLFYKWQFWKKGISPSEFRKLQVRDIKDVVEIENAINEKGFREGEVRNLMNNVKSRW